MPHRSSCLGNRITFLHGGHRYMYPAGNKTCMMQCVAHRDIRKTKTNRVFHSHILCIMVVLVCISMASGRFMHEGETYLQKLNLFCKIHARTIKIMRGQILNSPIETKCAVTIIECAFRANIGFQNFLVIIACTSGSNEEPR